MRITNYSLAIAHLAISHTYILLLSYRGQIITVFIEDCVVHALEDCVGVCVCDAVEWEGNMSRLE
jgi:hypothetical protein